jgi:hypothetical protein
LLTWIWPGYLRCPAHFSSIGTASISVSVIKDGKNGKQEFEGPRLERYENQKAMGSKGHAVPLFRGISGERPAPANFCVFARIFRNPVTGNTFGV